MTDLVLRLLALLQPIGLTAILVILFGWFSRATSTLKTIQIIMGLVFGVAAIIAMASPIDISQGVKIDLRNLFVGTSAAFFGWRGGCLTLSISAATRLYIGGDGAEVGIVAAAISGFMGLIWHHQISPRIPNILMSLPILAGMISLNLVTAFLLPAPVATIFITEVAPLVLILNFAGTGIFAILIYREIALIDEGKRLLTEATVDTLTRVLNRRYAMEIYAHQVQNKPTQNGVAMSCIDIDHFKRINDTYGHLAGDKVLVCTARRIAECLREHDLFCRMGGDEFVIIMTNVTEIEASGIAERCRAHVSETPIVCGEQNIEVSISIGTAWVQHAPAFEKIRNYSDEALYRAKSMGRDCSSFLAHPPESVIANAA